MIEVGGRDERETKRHIPLQAWKGIFFVRSHRLMRTDRPTGVHGFEINPDTLYCDDHTMRRVEVVEQACVHVRRPSGIQQGRS